MKAEMKAVVASLVVIALALTAVSGVTYSWFSDTEEAKIDVSTAKIDISGAFSDVTVSPDGSTTVTSTGSNIKINNLVDGKTVNAKYTVTNNSSVETKYRMYVQLVGDLDPSKFVMSIYSGTEPTALTFNSGIAYADGGNTGRDLAKGPMTIPYTVKIEFHLDTSDMGKSFSFNIITEAYQSDYTYSDVAILSPAGESTIPAGASGKDVKIVGTAPKATGSSAASAPISVELSSGVTSKVTSSGTSDVTLKAEMVDAPAGVTGTALSIGFTGSSVTDFGTDKVTVTVTVPGTVSDDFTVVYLGVDKGQPTDITKKDVGSGMVEITFTTTHFSDFLVSKDVVAIANTDSGVGAYASLPEAFRNVSAGGTIVLIKDVDDGQGIGIFSPEDDGKFYLYNGSTKTEINSNVVLNLNNHKYVVCYPPVGSSGTESQGFHVEDGYTLTIKDGTITSSGSAILMLFQNYANVTFDNVILDGSNLPSGHYTLSNCCGKITITGKTDIIAPVNGFAFDVDCHPKYPAGVYVVFDDEFEGSVSGIIEFEKRGDIPMDDWVAKSSLTISGNGDFSKAVWKVGLGANIIVPESFVFNVASSVSFGALIKGGFDVSLNADVSYDIKPHRENNETMIGTASTESVTIIGNGNKLVFNNTNSDWNAIYMVNPKATLILKDIVLDNSGYNAEGGAWNAHDLHFECNVEMNNVTCLNAVSVSMVANLINVKISDESATGDTYILWICAGANVTLDKCIIDGKSTAGHSNRAIAIKDEYITSPKSTTLTVSNTTITSDKYSAVLVTTEGGATINWDAGNDVSGTNCPSAEVMLEKDYTNVTLKDCSSTAKA